MNIPHAPSKGSGKGGQCKHTGQDKTYLKRGGRFLAGGIGQGGIILGKYSNKITNSNTNSIQTLPLIFDPAEHCFILN